MAAGDLITGPYQAELEGVLMGAGTAYEFSAAIAGLGLPGVRTSDVDRPQGHGVFVGPDYMDGKPITLSLNVDADTGADAEAALVDLAAAWRLVTDANEVKELAIRLAGAQVYIARGRPRRFAVDAARLPSGHAEVVAQFLATDPRLYGVDLETITLGPGSTTGGLSLPHGFPHGFGTAATGTGTVTNDGNEVTYPTATITVGVGGIAGFTIQNVTAAEQFSMTLNLLESDVVEVDFLERTVILNGTASRIGNVDRPDSAWLSAAPGSTEWAFAISGAGTATLDLTWHNAYLL